MKMMMERNKLLSTTVNGQDITLQRSAFDVNFVEADITAAVRAGENVFTYSSLRNLFGPHHFKLNPEPTGVSPDQFEFRGQWEQGKTAKYYTPNYHFVPFGADKIVLITKDGNQSS